MTKDKKLDVFYHGLYVGTLAEMPDKRIAFQYGSDWQKTGFALNPLSLPLKSDIFIPPEKNSDIFGGLFGTFADSLPDSWGELLMKRYLESIGVKPEELSILDRLAYIGSSGMGALEYYPSKITDFNIDAQGIEFDSIASECSKIISSRDSDQLDFIYKLAGSSGGTRPKIHLKKEDKEWIIKFPSKNDPSISGKREYDYSLCAKRIGINMTETELLPSKICEGYFKTERFDRINNTKLFTSTFSAILNVDYNTPSCDYGTFMKLIQVLTKDNKSEKKHMYRQMCFNVLAHNLDDHTKNFSFIYTEDAGWRLSPAYDITYSTTYFGEHTTSVNKKGKNIADYDLIKVGTDAGLSKDFAINTLKEIRENVAELDIYISGRPNKRSQDIKISDFGKDLNI